MSGQRGRGQRSPVVSFVTSCFVVKTVKGLSLMVDGSGHLTD